jgi:hypothetical protein
LKEIDYEKTKSGKMIMRMIKKIGNDVMMKCECERKINGEWGRDGDRDAKKMVKRNV